MADKKPPALTITMDLDASSPRNGLDLLRRARAFADEMNAAGIPVSVSGHVSIRVDRTTDDDDYEPVAPPPLGTGTNGDH